MMFQARYVFIIMLVLLMTPHIQAQDQEAEYDAIYATLAPEISEGEAFFEPADEKTILAAIARLEPLGEAGYIPAYNLLGSIYSGSFSEALTPDEDLAKSYFMKAIQSNNLGARAIGCLNMANKLLYEEPEQSSDVWLKIREYSQCAQARADIKHYALKPLAFSYLFGPDRETEIVKAEQPLVDWVDNNSEDGHSAYLLAKGLKYGWFGDVNEVGACLNFKRA